MSIGELTDVIEVALQEKDKLAGCSVPRGIVEQPMTQRRDLLIFCRTRCGEYFQLRHNCESVPRD